jgi:hypothetical protein
VQGEGRGEWRWRWEEVELAEVYPFNFIPPKELKEVAEEGGSLAESDLILLRLFDGGLILVSDSVVDSAPENGKGSDKL